MKKEGKLNFKFIFAALFLLVLMVFFAFAVSFDDTFRRPGNGNINLSRNVNFTFNATWSVSGEIVGNCSLWTNFTGIWGLTIENNTADAGVLNASISWINYTFSYDLAGFVWSIGCYNGTGPSGSANVLNFTTNRTLSVDTVAPVVTQTADI